MIYMYLFQSKKVIYPEFEVSKYFDLHIYTLPELNSHRWWLYYLILYIPYLCIISITMKYSPAFWLPATLVKIIAYNYTLSHRYIRYRSSANNTRISMIQILYSIGDVCASFCYTFVLYKIHSKMAILTICVWFFLKPQNQQYFIMKYMD